MKTPLPPPRRRERTQAQCRHRVGYFRHARGLCLVEDLVEAEYARIQISHQHRPDIGRAVEEYLDHRGTEDQHETRSLTRQRQRLLDQRSKLLQAHYADAIPLDLMKAEQARIGRQLEQVEARLAAHSGAIAIQKATLGKALDLLENCHQLYLTAREADRRILNQAIFTRIWVYDESIAGDLDELLTLLTHPDLLALLGVHGPASRNPALAVDQTPQLRQEVTEGLAKPSAALVRSVGGQETNKPPFLGTGGSKEFDLVRLVGLLSNPSRVFPNLRCSTGRRPARARVAGHRRLVKLDSRQRADVVRLFRDGSSVPQLTEQFGAHGQTIREVLLAAGEQVRTSRPRSLTGVQVGDALRLRSEGRTVSEIAQEVGGSESSVRRLLKIRQVDS